MPANVGEMFYTGDPPWHGEGIRLAEAATLEEALKVGGLTWDVGDIDLLTADDPPSPVLKRKAIVRLDRPAGHARRVLGVAHRGFVPVQNRDAGLLVDAVFGQGRRVYHTGGYLGDGEVVWLLARLDRTPVIGRDDIVQPYVLMANSHDGSHAFSIRLTTVRVVCQNTLAIAMSQRIGNPFRRAHQGSFAEHAQAAQEFYAATLRELDHVGQAFTTLSLQQCSNQKFQAIITALLPEPKKPRNADRNPGVLRGWEQRVSEVHAARHAIDVLRESGQGMGLDSAKGTFWGVLNAVLEYVDHHREVKDSRLAYALLGDRMDLKMRAFSVIQSESAKVA